MMKNFVTNAFAFGLFVLAPLGFVTWLVGAQFLNAAIIFLWGQAAWVIPLAVATLLFILGVRSESGGTIFVGVLSILAMLVGMVNVSYQKASHYYDASVTVQEVDADELSFRDRAPFDIARAVSPRNLGTSTGDATGVIKSIPAMSDHGLYSTSVERREILSGYERTQVMDVPLFGEVSNQDIEFCDWSDDAQLRFGGWLPTNNLKRAILWNVPLGTSISRNDAITICEEDSDLGERVPMLYVPLTTLQGFPFPIEVPGGVAIYNGHTGEITYDASYNGDLPLYPSSIAEKQRTASQSTISLWDYMFMHRAGWEDTSADEGDPNGDNRSEFNMASEDGETSYIVTPLTPRGDNVSISALGTVEGGNITRGQLNDYTVNTYKEGEHRPANSSVESTITANILAGFQSQGLKVFEVVPSVDGTWTATVGQDQSINYRAEVKINGDVYLYNSQGELVGQSGIGDTPTDGDVPEGDASDGDTSQDEPTMNLGKPLDEMSAEELREAANSILDELEQRAAQDESPADRDDADGGDAQEDAAE